MINGWSHDQLSPINQINQINQTNYEMLINDGTAVDQCNKRNIH